MNKTRGAVAAAVLSAFGLCGAGELIAAEDTARIEMMDNDVVRVEYDVNTGTFSAWRGSRQFIAGGRLGDFLPSEGLEVQTSPPITLKTAKPPPLPLAESIGQGVILMTELKHAGGRKATLWLFDQMPFLFVTTSIHNPTDKPMVIEEFTPLSAPIELGLAPKDLRALGYDGLASADLPKTTYMCISLADPKTRAGVVCGWLTHDRASGIAVCRPDGDKVRMEARSEYGRLMIPPGKTVRGETLVVGYFDDVLDGLELYADTIARHYKIKVKPVPSGYMTWYHARALDENRMPVLAKWCQENLNKYGFHFLQIDDGWQISRRDFTSHNPKGVYPGGMKPTAEVINRHGFTAGIWVTPFGWDHKPPVFADHQDWFVKRQDGSVYSVSWGGDCLDMSHPEARKFLHGVIDRIANDWGYKFFKLDALWAGMCAKILYPNPQYREDNFGDAVFHDPQVTNIEAFRRGLKVCREAAGKDVYLLGCTAAQNMRTLAGSIGLVDAIRVGVDSGKKWEGIVANVKVSSSIYYLHGRLWHNDADVLYLDKHFTLDQVRAWASWLAITGNLYMVSNWLPDAPAERIDAIKRTIPNHNLKARPVDLFESFPARIWHLRKGTGESRRDVVGLFNWGDEEQTINIDSAKLQLPSGRYAVFDYWENRFLEEWPGGLKLTLRPKSCRVIALRRMEHPVVLSTSRHVTQGIVELVEEKWGDRLTLEGTSRVVAGDPYEIRTAAPRVVGPWQLDRASVSQADRQAGVVAAITEGKGSENGRIVIRSPATRQLRWKIEYTVGKSIYRGP